MIFLGLAFFLSAFCIYCAIKRARFIEALPVFCWLSFMILPFMANIPLLKPDIAATQVIGIGFVTLALAIPTLWIIFQKDRLACALGENKINWTYWPYLLLGVSAIIAVIHLLRVDHIPLLYALTQEMSLDEINQKRAGFSRESSVTLVEKYIFNAHSFLLAAPAIALLLSRRKYKMAAASFIVFAFYLVLSTAKMPLFEFCAIVGALTLFVLFSAKWRERILVGACFGGLAFTILLSAYLALYAPNSFLGKAYFEMSGKHDVIMKQAHDIQPTLGDYARSFESRKDAKTLSMPLYLVNYGLYRIIYTPVGVSHRWYEYFSTVEPPVGFASILSRSSASDTMHPAKKIDLWALQSRFPRFYKDGYAYASLDADAFGRKGLAGVIIISLLLSAIRLGVYYLTPREETGRFFYITALALLSILPASAAMHSILVAHGLLGLILMMGGLSFILKFYGKLPFISFLRVHPASA